MPDPICEHCKLTQYTRIAQMIRLLVLMSRRIEKAPKGSVTFNFAGRSITPALTTNGPTVTTDK